MTKRKAENAKRYFEELRKLVSRCPKGYALEYDVDKGLFMHPDNCGFDVGDEHGATPAILCSVGVAYNPTKSSTDGYTLCVAPEIGQELIGLAALSSSALIETELD